MNDIKRRFETLALFDYRGVEEHLSAMASQGWRLEKIGTWFWTYRRAEPAQVRYAVTYSPDGSQFNPRPTQGQETLNDLCTAAGWTKVTDWSQMAIFCTEDPDPVPLETDEALRLQNIHRSMKKNFLPGGVFMLLLLLFLARDFFSALFTGDLYGMVKSNAALFAGAVALPAICYQIYILSSYFLWRQRSRRSVEDGGACLPVGRGCRRAGLAMWILLAAAVLSYLLAELVGGRRGEVLFFVIYLALFSLLVFLVRRTTALLRRRNASKEVNMAVTLVVDFILAFALIGGLTYTALNHDWFSSVTGSGETYEYQDQEWDVSPRQNFPLTLSDLTGEEYGHVSREAYRQGSFFVSEEGYSESVLLQDGPTTAYLSYTIYGARSPRLQESMLKDLLEDNPLRFRGTTLAVRRYVPEDPAPWGAEAVYRRYYDESPSDTWLLCWPGRVVEITLDEPPTKEQTAAVGRLLGPDGA